MNYGKSWKYLRLLKSNLKCPWGSPLWKSIELSSSNVLSNPPVGGGFGLLAPQVDLSLWIVTASNLPSGFPFNLLSRAPTEDIRWAPGRLDSIDQGRFFISLPLFVINTYIKVSWKVICDGFPDPHKLLLAPTFSSLSGSPLEYSGLLWTSDSVEILSSSRCHSM